MDKAPLCNECGTTMDSASVGSGGRIGWFCGQCELFRPNGKHITVVYP